MANIQSSPFPLVFRVPERLVEIAVDAASTVALRTYVRALEGMQKEALVTMATPSGRHTWRMVSDEGPYLNGTDLAPFPLAFFTAGMQFSLLSELLQHAEANGIALKRLSLNQDNHYTMAGSALQGTMVGGARPAEVTVTVEADASAKSITDLIHLAEQSSPAHAIMRDVLTNTFALTFNGRKLTLTDVIASANPFAANVEETFDRVHPDDSAEFRDAIITKVAQAQQLYGVEGGAASSLQAEQKRTLHVHGEANWLQGRLLETTIQLCRPIGSTFRFVCDETQAAGGQESAPPPLAYLAAGIGFCYMTQIGRYAQITRQKLNSYQIIQDNAFVVENATARALPVATHVYVEANEPGEIGQKTVWMGERTCFLHAAMRGSYPSVIHPKFLEPC